MEFKIQRPVFDQDQLNTAYDYAKPNNNLISSLISKFKKYNFSRGIFSAVPAVSWLPQYKWKRDIMSDMISGFTVAVMHIPQGMAYALLGNVPPIVGIYMAFFPVLAYFFLGTSRHISMGTFAVICLMTGKAVTTYSHTGNDNAHTSLNGTEIFDDQFTPIEVATAVTFVVGCYQLLMWIFRAGIVCTLLSETLVNGFTAGAAVHVLTSQLKDLLGMNVVKYKGPFKILFTFYDIITQIQTANLAAVLISCITVILLTLNNEVVKPWFRKKSKIPIPIELLAVVIGTLVSSFGYLSETYGITTVGHIPTGLPMPRLPPFSLLTSVAVDGFTITMVAYTISMSMALIFAQKLSYDVDSNQELFAQGVGNLVGSLFSCMPFTASLSRSLIQQSVGGKTQLASVFSCGILLFVLLWIGPFFEPLPRCVLAGVIVVALKAMFLQMKDFLRFWRCSFLDGIVWLVTFFTVVVVDIDYGLLAGISLSLASILIQGMKAYCCIMGVIPGTDLYVDLNRYKGTIEIPGIKIFHYCGGLNFATRTHFKNEVYRLVKVKPQHVLANLEDGKKVDSARHQVHQQKDGVLNLSFIGDHAMPTETQMTDPTPVLLKYLIVDFSALGYIDPSGVNALWSLAEDFHSIDIHLFVAGISGPVFETLTKCEAMSGNTCRTKIFPTIHDAVVCAQSKINEEFTIRM